MSKPGYHEQQESITTTVPPKLYAYLQALRRVEDRSLSAIVRRILDEAMQKDLRPFR